LFFLFFFSILINSTIFCQEKNQWTLNDCISYALENNIQIKQQVLNTQYQENLYKQAKSDVLPDLNASGSYGTSFGRALDQTTYEFTENQTVQSINMNVSSTVNLFNGLQKYYTKKQSHYDLKAELQNLAKLKNDISLNIAAGYLQILFNEELVSVATEQLEVTNQQVERTRVMVEAGSLAKGELLQMEAQVAADELSLINAKNTLDISYLTLAQLLDLDSAENFSIVIPEIEQINDEVLLTSVNDIYQEATGILPQIKSAEYQYESSLMGKKIAEGSRYPRLSLTASYGTGFSDTRQQVVNTEYLTQTIGQTTGGEDVVTTVPSLVYGNYPLGDQFKDNASTNIFLNLSVPIFTKFQINRNIDNSRLLVKNSQLELEYQQNQLYKEIQQAFADAVAALKKYNASEKTLTATEESFKYTREKYEVGLVNAVDFNLSQNQLVSTQSDLLQSKYDYIFKTVILEFYKGKPLELNY